MSARALPADAADAIVLEPVEIKPSTGWKPVRFRELWEYRELLYFLVWRDVKVRYKQTLLGAAWAILQPLLTMVVFSVFFGGLAKVGSDGVPYPLFSFAGLLPWTFFAQGLSQAAASFVSSANLIKKIYFPRLLMPVAAVAAALVDFVISFGFLLVLMAFYRMPVSPRALCVFPLLLLAAAAALGLGMWFATLNVEYRDIRYVLPFVVQLGLFVTPVIYPTSKVLPRLAEFGIPAWVYALNPMVGVVEGFRWALLRSDADISSLLAVGTAVTVTLLVTGSFYLHRMERTFADVV
jgi:lipopolysaccharide transport system permease protein